MKEGGVADSLTEQRTPDPRFGSTVQALSVPAEEPYLWAETNSRSDGLVVHIFTLHHYFTQHPFYIQNLPSKLVRTDEAIVTRTQTRRKRNTPSSGLPSLTYFYGRVVLYTYAKSAIELRNGNAPNERNRTNEAVM
jgi:hypothetical protein